MSDARVKFKELRKCMHLNIIQGLASLAGTCNFKLCFFLLLFKFAVFACIFQLFLLPQGQEGQRVILI